MNPNPIDVKANSDFTIIVKFDNSEVRVFDVKPYITGSWFGKLSDPAYFKTAHVANGTVEWEDGQDLAPHELYELSTLIA